MENTNLNSYDLSRNWFNWCFENPEKISPNHTALYFFCIEHCNRLGWKQKFGLPTTMAKEAIGIHSYNTYIKTLNDLIEWGFINLIEKSKNQYSSNIIELSKFNKALDKALDKALINHVTKQVKSTEQSNSSINKQETTKQINYKQLNNVNFDLSFISDIRFEDLILKWIEYKKNITSQIQVECAYKDLFEISKGDYLRAEKILNYSINGGYKNFYYRDEKESESDFKTKSKLAKMQATEVYEQQLIDQIYGTGSNI